MALTPRPLEVLHLRGLGGVRGWRGVRGEHSGHALKSTHTHTHRRGRDSRCVFDATDRCCRLVPAVPYLAPQVSWAAFGANDTHTLTHTHLHTGYHSYHISHLWLTRFMCCAPTYTAVFQLVEVFVCAQDGDVFTIWRNVQYLVMWKAALSGQESHKHTLFYWMDLRCLCVHPGAGARNLNALTCRLTVGDLILLVCVWKVNASMFLSVCLSFSPQYNSYSSHWAYSRAMTRLKYCQDWE